MEKAKVQKISLRETSSIIKQENPGDEEIRIMAAKLEEQMQRQVLAIQQQRRIHEQQQIRSKLRTTTYNINTAKATYYNLRFGWAKMKQIEPGMQENNLRVIPFIYRHKEKICSERMLQQKLYDYPLLPNIEMCSFKMRKYDISASEARLLDEINFQHCEGQFGGAFTQNEKLLNLRDALNYYQYRVECHRLMTFYIPGSIPKKCGFLRMEGISTMAFVVVNGVVHVPMFYLQGVPPGLMAKTQTVRGWDLAYLKFCCTEQGIFANILEGDYLIVIPIDEVKNDLNENGVVKYIWPTSEEDLEIPDDSGT